MLPWAVSLTMSGIVWRWALNGQFGMVNTTLGDLGLLSQPVEWLATADHRLPHRDRDRHPGLDPVHDHRLPRRPLLAAGRHLRGGEDRRRLRRATLSLLTLPLLRPFINIVLVLNFIYVFNSFPLIWVMTQGDPANSTDILVTWLYKLAFRYGELGLAAALSIVMFLILLALTITYATLAMRNEKVRPS